MNRRNFLSLMVGAITASAAFLKLIPERKPWIRYERGFGPDPWYLNRDYEAELGWPKVPHIYVLRPPWLDDPNWSGDWRSWGTE
jgi:hypothetical protein